MKIHEYQAKELFRQYNVPVPEGGVAFTSQEARAVADRLGGFPVVVKAQIHAGGRGKGGGVKLAHSPEEVDTVSGGILGMTLVTHQTGPEGRLVKKVLVEQGLNIRTDRSGLQRIIYNLLENALKYNQKGGSISLDANFRDNQVIIVVQDTGVGISPNDLPYIFDRFYRTDYSRSKPGNGLGLSLVKAITTNLGGTVDVKSRVNDGSAFLVSLPQTL